MNYDYRQLAQSYINKGISVIPLKGDSKMPSIRWKQFQQRLMTPEEVNQYFHSCGGIAALTGKFSRVYLLDFDLKHQLEHQDYWKAFTDLVPQEILAKCLINTTKNHGFHIWCRTSIEEKTRKITRRFLTIDEMHERCHAMVEKGANVDTALRIILNNPLETVIENRSRGGYGVISHTDYTLVSSPNGIELTDLEMQFLIDTAESLDCLFKKKQVFTGEAGDYGIMRRFNDDATPEGVVRMLEASGLYSSIGTDNNGNYQLKRIGSSSSYSAYLYADTKLFKSFGQNVLSEEKDVLSPFDIYCIVNDCTMHEAIKKIKEKYAARKQ